MTAGGKGFEVQRACHALLAVAVAWLAVGTALATETPTLRGFAVAQLHREDGLPSTQVHAQLQEEGGALWFAGPAGLSRYDGSTIEVFGPRDGLSTQGLRSLARGPGGAIWIGHDLGADRRTPDGRFEAITPAAWEFGFVDAIVVGDDGTWLGTNSGLAHWSRGSGIRLETTLPRGLVSDLLRVGETIWASGPTIGLWHHRDGVWNRFPQDALAPIGSLYTLAAADEDGLWLGGGRGFALIDRGREVVALHRGDSGASKVTALLPVDGELWVAQGGNLDAWVRDGVGDLVVTGRLMSNVRINELTMDAQGNVWIATDSDGVAKISVLRRAIAHAPMPCATQVYSIRRSAGQGFLVGGEHCSWTIPADGPGPVRLPGLDRIKVWDLIEASSGDRWAATQQGLYRSPPDGAFAPAALGSPLDSTPGRVLLERDDGLWVATVEGLFVVAGGVPRKLADADDQPLGYVYTMIEDGEGSLWLGTIGRGAFREDAGGRLQPVRDEPLRARSNIYAIAFDGAGGVALVQDGQVLYAADDRPWRRLERATDDNVAGWSLRFLSPAELWLGSSSGLVQYELPAGTVQRRLTEAMGLSGEEFTTSRSLARDGDQLLLGLDSGLSVVDTAVIEQIGEEPQPLLSSVRWTRAVVDDSGEIPTVAHGSWTLDLGLASNWFIDERGLKYRYRLDGFDQSWSQTVDRTRASARYTGLPAGSYRFVAQVFSPLEGWGDERTLFRFEVDRRWWARPASLALWFVLSLLVLTGLVRLRTARLQRRALTLGSLVDERTEELQAANLRLARLASQDGLTGLTNRRALWTEAERYRSLARREGLSLGLVVFDLDHFKVINDRYGHPVGDAVLVHVAETLRGTLRENEVLARWGGEEFAVLLAPSAKPPDLETAGERIRKALVDQPFALEHGGEIRLSCSVGASAWDPETDGFEEMLRRSDLALYAAKKRRNRTVVWSPELDPAKPAEP